jgi:predicted NUDIX family phosphoesterase
MTNFPEEQVLVVPTALFHGVGHFQGFLGGEAAEPYLDVLMRPENLSFRPRSEVEADPSFKQLIPYVLFCHKDALGRTTVFEYVRGKGQGEGRLHKKRSVGIGGHISSDDTSNESDSHPFEEGMRRELEEEVEVSSAYEKRCVGLINDDETEVGRVHLGVVYCFDVETPDVRSNEPDILESGFKAVESLLNSLEGFETWSSICLKAIFGDTP